uniref:C2H2-type domain-containing protein n=1 Tax=Timema monikensis TaxID=170555 RepID=A0A7R9E1V0_9NEOP|nr:unnamed protein product [Timema monikensis]
MDETSPGTGKASVTNTEKSLEKFHKMENRLGPMPERVFDDESSIRKESSDKKKKYISKAMLQKEPSPSVSSTTPDIPNSKEWPSCFNIGKVKDNLSSCLPLVKSRLDISEHSSSEGLPSCKVASDKSLVKDKNLPIGISTLTSEELQKLVTENLRNLPSPPPNTKEILESVTRLCTPMKDDTGSKSEAIQPLTEQPHNKPVGVAPVDPRLGNITSAPIGSQGFDRAQGNIGFASPPLGLPAHSNRDPRSYIQQTTSLPHKQFGPLPQQFKQSTVLSTNISLGSQQSFPVSNNVPSVCPLIPSQTTLNNTPPLCMPLVSQPNSFQSPLLPQPMPQYYDYNHSSTRDPRAAAGNRVGLMPDKFTNSSVSFFHDNIVSPQYPTDVNNSGILQSPRQHFDDHVGPKTDLSMPNYQYPQPLLNNKPCHPTGWSDVSHNAHHYQGSSGYTAPNAYNSNFGHQMGTLNNVHPMFQTERHFGQNPYRYVKPGVRPVSHVDNALLRPVRREPIHSKPYTPCTYSEWKRSKQNADLPDDKRRYNDRIHTGSPPRSSRSPPRRPKSPPRRPRSPPTHSRSPPKTSTASVKLDSDSKQDGCSSDDLNSPLNSLYGAVIAAKTGRGYGPQKFKIPKRPQEPLPNKQKTQASSDEVPQSNVTNSEDASNKSVTESEAQECIGEKKLLEELVGDDGKMMNSLQEFIFTGLLKNYSKKMLAEKNIEANESTLDKMVKKLLEASDESDVSKHLKKPTKRIIDSDSDDDCGSSSAHDTHLSKETKVEELLHSKKYKRRIVENISSDSECSDASSSKVESTKLKSNIIDDFDNLTKSKQTSTCTIDKYVSDDENILLAHRLKRQKPSKNDSPTRALDDRRLSDDFKIQNVTMSCNAETSHIDKSAIRITKKKRKIIMSDEESDFSEYNEVPLDKQIEDGEMVTSGKSMIKVKGKKTKLCVGVKDKNSSEFTVFSSPQHIDDLDVTLDEETPILKKPRRKEDGLSDTESVVTELYTGERGRIQGDESDITRNIKPTKRGKAKKKQIKKLNKGITAVGSELNDEDALETTSESSDIHPTRKKFKKRNSLELLQEDVKDMFISDDVLTANGYRTCRLSKEILDEMSEKMRTNSIKKTQTFEKIETAIQEDMVVSCKSIESRDHLPIIKGANIVDKVVTDESSNVCSDTGTKKPKQKKTPNRKTSVIKLKKPVEATSSEHLSLLKEIPNKLVKKSSNEAFETVFSTAQYNGLSIISESDQPSLPEFTFGQSIKENRDSIISLIEKSVSNWETKSSTIVDQDPLKSSSLSSLETSVSDSFDDHTKSKTRSAQNHKLTKQLLNNLNKLGKLKGATFAKKSNKKFISEKSELSGTLESVAPMGESNTESSVFISQKTDEVCSEAEKSNSSAVLLCKDSLNRSGLNSVISWLLEGQEKIHTLEKSTNEEETALFVNIPTVTYNTRHKKIANKSELLKDVSETRTLTRPILSKPVESLPNTLSTLTHNVFNEEPSLTYELPDTNISLVLNNEVSSKARKTENRILSLVNSLSYKSPKSQRDIILEGSSKNSATLFHNDIDSVSQLLAGSISTECKVDEFNVGIDDHMCQELNSFQGELTATSTVLDDESSSSCNIQEPTSLFDSFKITESGNKTDFSSQRPTKSTKLFKSTKKSSTLFDAKSFPNPNITSICVGPVEARLDGNAVLFCCHVNDCSFSSNDATPYGHHLEHKHKSEKWDGFCSACGKYVTAEKNVVSIINPYRHLLENHLVSRLKREMQNRRTLNFQNAEYENATAIDKNRNKSSCISDELPENVVNKVEITPLPSNLGEDLDDSIAAHNSNKDFTAPLSHPSQDFTVPVTQSSQDVTLPLAHPSKDVMVLAAYPSQDVTVLVPHQSQDVTVSVAHTIQKITAPIAHPIQDISVPLAHSNQAVSDPLTLSSPNEDIDVTHCAPVFRIRVKRLPGDMLSFAKDNLPTPVDINETSNENIDDTDVDVEGLTIDEEAFSPAQVSLDCSDSVFSEQDIQQEPDNEQLVEDNFLPILIESVTSLNPDASSSTFDNLESELTSPSKEIFDHSYARPTFSIADGEIVAVENTFLLKQSSSTRPSLLKLNPPVGVAAASTSKSACTVNKATLSEKVGGAGSQRRKLQHKSSQAPSYSKSQKMPEVYNIMLEPRKLRHLYKCMGQTCSYTTNVTKNYIAHCKEHEEMRKKPLRKQKGIDWRQCAYCCVNLKTVDELVDHIQSTHGHCLFQCTYCFFRAMSQSYVVLHQNTSHTGEQLAITMCKVVKNISERIDLIKERNEVVLPYICKQGTCNERFYVHKDFYNHLTRQHSQLTMYSCHLCESTSFKPDTLMTHYKLHSYCFYQCMYCVHGGDTKEDMHHHLCNFHPNQPSTVLVRLFQTKDQSSAKNQVEDLITIDLDQEVVFNGMLLMPTPGPIETDEDSEDENDMLNSPTELAHNSGNNPVDGSVFKKQNINKAWKSGSANNKQLKKNTLVIPNNTPEVPFDYKNVDLAEIARTGLTGLELYLCGNVGCTYAGPTAANLKDHIYICDFARDSRNLVCKHCRRGFKQTHTLVEHVRSHGTKRFGCWMSSVTSSCMSIFPTLSQSAPLASMSFCAWSIHPVKQPMRVSSLSNSSTTNVSKTSYGPNDVHQLPMNAIFPQPISCAVCQFTTKVRVNLVRHLELHSSSNLSVAAVPSDCPVNPVPCLDKKELMFDKMVNLAASSHLRGEHKSDNTLSQEDEAKIPKYIPEHMRYVCGVTNCKYMACDETMLRYHIRALHCDEMSYKCPHCEEHVLDKTKVAVSIERLTNMLIISIRNLREDYHQKKVYLKTDKRPPHYSFIGHNRLSYLLFVKWLTTLQQNRDDHVLKRWNLVTNETVKVADLPQELYPTDLHWFPRAQVVGKKQGSDLLLITSADGKFHLINRNGRIEKSVDAHKGAVLTGRWSFDGAGLLTAGEDGQVKIWSRSGMLRSTIIQSDTPIYSAAWGPDSNQVLHTLGKNLVIKHLAPNSKPNRWKAHDGLILKVAWNPSNNLIVSGGEDCHYKVWDTYGRQLFNSITHDYPITALSWSPGGGLFAVGSFNTLRLCDRVGWSYSLEKPNTGSIFNIAWSSDGTQVAGACGNGHVIFAHIIERRLEWKNYEASMTSRKSISVRDVSNEAREQLEFPDRVIKLALGYNHLVVVTPSQCHVYSTRNWNTPAIFNLREGSVSMVLLAERHFLLAEKASVYLYNYDCKLICSPRWAGMQPETLNLASISISNDTIAVRDQLDNKTVHLFEVGSARSLVDLPPLHHWVGVLEVALNQAGSALERQIAVVDRNRDLYLALVRGTLHKKLRKLAPMIQSLGWNCDTNILATVQDTNLTVWYYPMVLYADSRLLKKTAHMKDSRQRMNNHRFDTNHKDPDKPVPIHASTHNQDFQTCYTTKILRAFPKQCNSSQLRQWELAHQWITKSRLPPGLNRR